MYYSLNAISFMFVCIYVHIQAGTARLSSGGECLEPHFDSLLRQNKPEDHWRRPTNGTRQLERFRRRRPNTSRRIAFMLCGRNQSSGKTLFSQF